MTPIEYQKLALRTMADQDVIRHRIYDYGTLATQLENAARGMCNDTGEFSEAIKRWLEYGQPLDKVNLVEELGDVLWRIAQAADAIDVTLEHIMERNVRKLAIRYGDKYSDYLAAEANRDRAAERSAVAESELTPAGAVMTFRNGRWEPAVTDDQLAESHPPQVKVSTAGPAPVVITEPSASFGDALVRDVPDNSYDRLCAKCRKPIHRTNQTQVCADCYKPPIKAEDPRQD